MAKRVSLASLARYGAGAVSITWAVLGLADALAAGLGRGADAGIIVEAAVNVILMLAALLAVVGVRSWRPLVLGGATVVTADRLLTVAAAGDLWLGVSSIAMLVALAAIVWAAGPP
jgi:hypothetical protein